MNNVVLSVDQMSHIDQTLQDLHSKRLMLNSIIDTQVILQILIEKGIATREEVGAWREKVSKQGKYSVTSLYLNTAIQQAEYLKNNPEELLRTMMDAKFKQ